MFKLARDQSSIHAFKTYQNLVNSSLIELSRKIESLETDKVKYELGYKIYLGFIIISDETSLILQSIKTACLNKQVE